MRPNNDGVPHNSQNDDGQTHTSNLEDLNPMTNWCRLHDTFAIEVNSPLMEKMVKIAQANSQHTQNNVGGNNGPSDTTMGFETIEDFRHLFQEENEPEVGTYDAQAFQAKGDHFLRNHNKGPFTTSKPPNNNLVSPNHRENNNPLPPKGLTKGPNRGHQTFAAKPQFHDTSYNLEEEMKKVRSNMSMYDVLKFRIEILDSLWTSLKEESLKREG